MACRVVVHLALAALGCGVLPADGLAGILGVPSGSGPLPAVAESVASLPGHTLYRPVQLPKKALPVFLWGNGACRDNGLAYAGFLRQIASQGYFVISVGVPREERPPDAAPQPPPPPPVPNATPGQPEPRNTPDETQPEQLLEALDWAARENARAGGPYEGHLDLQRVAVGGHSCGGLQAIAVSDDPRIRTTLVLNSGVYVRASGGKSGVRVGKDKLAALHGPMLYLTGGPDDIAYPNASDDVARIAHLPVFMASLPVGHGGTYWADREGGAFARVATRWLDFQLKGSADASWDFAGPACRLCKDRRWTVVQKQMGLPKGPFRESRYVPVRDGTRLAVNIYRPAVDGRPVDTPKPVLFAFTPYRARYRDAAGSISELEALRSFNLGDIAEHDYVVAIADVRGKGASFGSRRGFQDRTEANDGHDIVQWLAAQPWSAGKVGMVGCSYLGGTTVHVASTAPPALKAIFTGATDLDKYDFVRRGGITAQFNTRPDEPLSDDLLSVPLDEDVDGALLRAAVAEHARNTPMAPLWYGMPYRDSVSPLTGNRFWEEVGPYPYIDRIRNAGIATYFWGNWNDEPTEQIILLAANLNGKLLIGPGSHCVPPPDFDIRTEAKRYFDQHLRGINTGLDGEPRVTYRVDGVETGSAWRRSAKLPGADASRERWFLGAGRSLGSAAQGAGHDAFPVDYGVGSDAYFSFWVDSQASHGLAYASAPLAGARTLTGSPVVELQIAADREDVDLFAYLEMVDEVGQAEVLSFGRLKASHRKVSRAPYDVLGLPWHSGRAADAKPLVPGKPVALRLALTPVARVIKAGQRLRLVVTGADPRQRNLADLRQDPPPQVTVGYGKAAPSWVELPWVR